MFISVAEREAGRLEREDLWYSNLVTDLDGGGAEVLVEEWRNGQDLPCQHFPLE